MYHGIFTTKRCRNLVETCHSVKINLSSRNQSLQCTSLINLISDQIKGITQAMLSFAKLSSVTKRRLADVTAFHRQDRSGEDRLPGHLDFENDGKNRKRD